MAGFRVITTFHNAGPHTIWAKLVEKLGREPTPAEIKADIRRILDKAAENAADVAEMARLDRAAVPSWKKRRRPPAPSPKSPGATDAE